MSYQTPLPDIVEISLRNVDTTSYRDRYLYYKTTTETLETIKTNQPKAKIVIGNTGFSMFPNEKMDEDFVRLVVAAGCDFFSFSTNGISEHGLRASNKPIQTKDIDNIYQLAKQIPKMKLTSFNFFVFPPGQRLIDFHIFNFFDNILRRLKNSSTDLITIIQKKSHKNEPS